MTSRGPPESSGPGLGMWQASLRTQELLGQNSPRVYKLWPGGPRFWVPWSPSCCFFLSQSWLRAKGSLQMGGMVTVGSLTSELINWERGEAAHISWQPNSNDALCYPRTNEPGSSTLGFGTEKVAEGCLGCYGLDSPSGLGTCLQS